MNVIKSILQRHKWSIKAAAATAVFLGIPTCVYHMVNKDDENSLFMDRLFGVEEAKRTQTSHNLDGADDQSENDNRQGEAESPSSSYDLENDDWLNEFNSPLEFLNKFVFTPQNSKRSFTNDDDVNDDDPLNPPKNPSPPDTIDLFKTLFPPPPLQFQHHQDYINPPSSNIKNNNVNESLPYYGDDLVGSTLSSMAETFTELLTGTVSDRAFGELINHAREKTQNREGLDASHSFTELINIIMNDFEKVRLSLTRNFEVFDDLDIVDPMAVFYYLENEDEQKNPSWKRRMHRFCQGVDLNQINYLNDALKLAELSYADTAEEIKETLESGKLQIGKDKDDRYELIYSQLESYPGKPSHYLAVKRNQSLWSPSLEILLVVRGTKTVPDMLTDALLDATDYRGGKAHAGILKSGKFLVKKHSHMMESLLNVSKKKQIKLFIVGHSLGAGASTIAGMELNDNPLYDVSVIGFGCPALLSKDLSEATSSYVTTVIADSDIVPRMSATSIGNVVLNMLEYDWTSKAKRDVDQALQELFFENNAFLFSNETIQSIRRSMDERIMDLVKFRIKKQTERRMEPTLFPPGNCIHFYRDGIAVNGAFTPAGFFREIDISRTMVDDHTISGYRRVFLEIMRNFHGDDHFSFEGRKK